MLTTIVQYSLWLPPDRDLALRGKIKTGWSTLAARKPNRYIANGTGELTIEERNTIQTVINRADVLERKEQIRIGLLSLQYEQLCSNARGNGDTSCIICGYDFVVPKSRVTIQLHICQACTKAVCSRCKADYKKSSGGTMVLCRLCYDNRELWKKSGAWLMNGSLSPVVMVSKEELEKIQMVCVPNVNTCMYLQHLPHLSDTEEEVRCDQISQLNVSPASSSSSEQVAKDRTSVDSIDEMCLVDSVVGTQTQTDSYFINVSLMPEPMFYTQCTIIEEVDAMNSIAKGEEKCIHIDDGAGDSKEEGKGNELQHQENGALDIHQKETTPKDVTTSSVTHSEVTSSHIEGTNISKKEEHSDTQYQQPTSELSEAILDRVAGVEKDNTERSFGTTVLVDVGICTVEIKKQSEVENIHLLVENALNIIDDPEDKNNANLQNEIVSMEEMVFKQVQPEALVMSNIFNVSWLHCAEQQTAVDEHSQESSHQSDMNTAAQHTDAAQGPIGRDDARREGELSMQLDERKHSDVKDYSKDKEVTAHRVDGVRPLTAEMVNDLPESHSTEGVHQSEVNTDTEVTVPNVSTEEMKSTSVEQQNTSRSVQIHVRVQGDIIIPRVVDEPSEANSKVTLTLQPQHQGADMRGNGAQKVAPGVADVRVNNAFTLANERAALSGPAGSNSSHEHSDLLSRAEHEGVDSEEVLSPQHSEEFEFRRARVVRRKKATPRRSGDEQGELLPRPHSAAIERSISPINNLIPQPHSGFFESNASLPCQPTMQSRPHSVIIERTVSPHHDPTQQFRPDQASPPSKDIPVLSGHQTSRIDRKAGFLRKKGAQRNGT